MLEILKYPDERLKQHSRPVEKFDAELHQALDAMAETMYGSNGVGLAAPQVGIFKRFFVIDVDWSDKNSRGGKLHEFINPVLSEKSGRITYEEGCLSIPGYNEEVNRAARVTVQYQDRFGQTHFLTADDLLAVAIQHEYDHLDGVLFIERVSLIKRRLAKRKLAKNRPL